MFYVIDDHNRVYGMVYERCECHPNKQDNSNGIYFPRTAANNSQKSQYHIITIIYFKLVFTLCPSVLNCTGKHMLQTSQWKKFERPPSRQMPHPWQWYWSLSSSSNKLHIKQVYYLRTMKAICKKNLKIFFSYLSKSYATVFTIGLHFLSGVTLGANQFCQRFTIEMVGLVFIMAITALVEFTTARGLCGWKMRELNLLSLENFKMNTIIRTFFLR